MTKKSQLWTKATSLLDVNTENFILEQIKSLKRKKNYNHTYSQYKNTLKYCDKIYEIKAR